MASQTSLIPEKSASISQAYLGPALELPINRLTFEDQINSISVSMLSIYNHGSVPIHFDWERVQRPCPFTVNFFKNVLKL